jgi:hypothetical protein
VAAVVFKVVVVVAFAAALLDNNGKKGLGNKLFPLFLD